MRSASDGLFTLLAGANPDDALDALHEDLAIADPAGIGGLDDAVDAVFDDIVRDNRLDFHLGNEIDDVFSTSIQFRVPLLSTESLDLGHGDPRDPDRRKLLADSVQLVWLDDGSNAFHASCSLN